MKLDRVGVKMHLLKQAVNYLANTIKGLTPSVQPDTPQSRLITSIWARLEDAAAKEVETGCWNDKNFRNLLESSKKAMIFLCEHDRYYKRWIGLLAFILAEELEKARGSFTYEEALNMTVRPLGLTREEFEKHRAALFEMHLCGYLHGLSKLSQGDISQIHEARETEGYVDFPGGDPDAQIRLYFPASDPPYFFMMLRERYEKER